MKADHLSFRRAVSVSVLGFLIQLAVTLLLLFYGIYGRDHAAFSASMFSAVGVVVWLGLLLLFDQHRRERLEAQEAEAMASEATSSVFEEGASDLRLASKRLITWYKFVIPVLSVVIGSLLLALGYWRLTDGRGLARPGALPDAIGPGWAIAIGLIIAFIGFVFARFVAGMSKQAIWANLRGGSAYAVGVAILGLAIAVAQFIDVAGSDAGRRLLVLAVPILTIALGVEVFLNFLLDLYRPRKKGQFPRPAFDSRVLAFASAPDRIARSIGEALDYQFGFGVQETWFYRLIRRAWPLLLVFGVFVVWGLSAFAVVAPDQQGMILRFGRVVHDDVGPGLHVKAPWPIDRVVIPELVERDVSGEIEVIGLTASGVRTLQLGTPPPPEDNQPILWTNEHAQEEIFHITQPSQSFRAAEGNRSNDLALVAVEVPLTYSVSDPMLYDMLGPPGVREDILRVVGQRAVTLALASIPLDRVLGADRGELAIDLRSRVQVAFDRLNPSPEGEPRGAGIEVLSVTVAHMHPPRDVAPKFEQVVIAQQNREAKVEVARTREVDLLAGVAGSVDAAREIVSLLDQYAAMRDGGASDADLVQQELEIVDLMSRARGEAAQTLAIAKADRWGRHMNAWSDALRYEGKVRSFVAAPLVYRASLYFETLRESLVDSRIYLVSGDIPDFRVTTELQDDPVGIGLFQKDPLE